MTMVDVMIVLAVVVIVPAAAPLHPDAPRWAPAAAVLAGVPAVVALLLDQARSRRCSPHRGLL